MLIHSIRARLLIWFTALMLLILTGFGVTAYQLNRTSAMDRVDKGLDMRISLLQRDWRASFPAPEGAPKWEGREPGPRRWKGDRKNPPPRWGREGKRGAVERDPPSPPPLRISDRKVEDVSATFGERSRPGPRLTLSSETEALFADKTPGSYYYAAWRREGTLVTKSENFPEEIAPPEAEQEGATFPRSRDQWREAFYFTDRGDSILVGVSITETLAASRRFAWTIVAVGAAVLLIGVGGGWMIISRSFRPLREISATARRIAAGDLAERVTVTDARSELGELAGVLNSTFARLDGAFAEQKTFIADASHELRTPLTLILTETQRALSRERSAEEYRRAVEHCQVSANEMKRVTESLLELAWLDSGQDLPLATVDLAELAAAAAESVRPLCAERNLRLDVEATPVAVAGDADRLRQVVVNLLQNAIRYNRDNGSIHLSTGQEKERAFLRVRDTGIGISDADLPHIFKRFYRADKARSRAHGNTGLGLSICQLIVEKHRGSIEVESVEGEGTTFTVRLPIP